MDIAQLSQWFVGLEERLTERQNVIGRELLKELRKRIGFLLEVGWNRTLKRPAWLEVPFYTS